MESNSAIIILTPLILPVTTKLGIDPIHMGLVMVLNLMMGLLTPPVGMCLYAVSRVAKISFDRMVKACYTSLYDSIFGTVPYHLCTKSCNVPS